MTRMVSFAVLLAILLVIAVLFYKVMANFFLPMFLAVLLVVIFHPLHQWFLGKCKGRDRLAAGLTTVAIVLTALLPLLLILSRAVLEVRQVVTSYQELRVGGAGPIQPAETPIDQKSWPDAVLDTQALAKALVDSGNRFGLALSTDEVQATIREKIRLWLGPLALSSVRFSGNLLLGVGVMIISLYYFLADGPWMIRKIMRLSPLDDRYEDQLIDEFAKISRAVVLAALLSAVVQGLLAGAGYFFAGVEAVFLLMVLTMLLAMVPFIGAAAVWAPVCLWLFFIDERHVAAVLLAVYGAAIVSMADNVIKPLVLHGRSNLHPLLALLSVLGGVQALGPIGIFVGPMVVAFLHALLNMLHSELERMSEADGGKSGGSSEKEGKE